MITIHRNPLPSDSIMSKLQQVFWLSDQSSGCRLPIRMLPDSGSTRLQPPYPITAAGPPRFYTVFHNAEATKEKMFYLLQTTKITTSGGVLYNETPNMSTIQS